MSYSLSFTGNRPRHAPRCRSMATQWSYPILWFGEEFTKEDMACLCDSGQDYGVFNGWVSLFISAVAVIGWTCWLIFKVARCVLGREIMIQFYHLLKTCASFLSFKDVSSPFFFFIPCRAKSLIYGLQIPNRVHVDAPHILCQPSMPCHPYRQFSR